jgi:signal transduction histidine kinase/ligand-binding sensor domain-containing protein/ActR/RegA family two-component response regulator
MDLDGWREVLEDGGHTGRSEVRLQRFERTRPRDLPNNVALIAIAILSLSPIAGAADESSPGVQAVPLPLRRWRFEGGLPLSNVSMMAQTADGYLWLAAPREGLIRFDGEQFVETGYDWICPDEYPGNLNLTALTATRDGSLWIGTRSGLWRLRAREWKQFGRHDGLLDGRVSALHGDAEGAIWVGTPTGIFRVSDGSVESYAMKERLRGQSVTAIHRATNGVVWIGTSRGSLFQLDRGQFHEIPTEYTTDIEAVNAIIEGWDQSIWVGMWGERIGRFKPDGTRKLYGPSVYPINHRLLSLVEDRWHSIWMATNRGLFVVSDVDEEDTGQMRKDVPVDESSTQCLLRDHGGTIWAGTESELCAYSDWSLKVFGMTEGLPGRNVSSVSLARGGGLWVSTINNGFARLDNERVVAKFGTAQGLSSQDITSICETADGSLWVGTWGNGLNTRRGERFERLVVDGMRSDEIIRSILEDSHHNLWIGTWEHGLKQMRDGVVRQSFTTAEGLGSDKIRVLAEDQRDNLWIATDSGLSQCFHGRIVRTFNRADGLSDDSIFALHADADGSLWIGTQGGGINRLSPDGRIRTYASDSGIPCKTICEILEDGRGNLWVGSLKGIFRVAKRDLEDYDEGKIQTVPVASFDHTDGMHAAQCNRGTQSSGCRTADGRLWFATIDGVVMIDPDNLPPESDQPPVLIENVWVDGGPVDAGTRELTLPPGHHEIKIRYCSPRLRGPSKTQYEFLLEGYNTDWVANHGNREVNFTNVGQGAHRFLVKVSGGEGRWSETSTLLLLNIAPPFYRTPWFIGTSTMGSLAAIGLFLHARAVRQKARERELLVLVERRTTEVRAAHEAAEQANRAKDRFLAVLSHELRTPLTPVLLAVSSLLKERLAPETSEQIDMIKRNIELEARLVDDLLDVSRISRGELRLKRERVDVHQVIHHALQVCKPDIKENDLRVELALCARSHHVDGDYARLIQVAWNLIGNAAKFTRRSGTLSIQTRNIEAAGAADPSLVIEFRDNGEGVDPARIERIFAPFEQGAAELRDRGAGLGLGLAICRAVVEAHGGKVTAESEGVGRGATFRIELASIAEPQSSDAHTEGGGRQDSPDTPAPLRVLIAEDNPDTLRYLEATLTRAGHRTTAAPNLSAAIESANGREFDLLVSDIEMPDGSGYDLMRALAPRGIRGIAVSGYGSTEDKRNSREAGFSIHLTKPIVGDVLIDAIDYLYQSEAEGFSATNHGHDGSKAGFGSGIFSPTRTQN